MAILFQILSVICTLVALGCFIFVVVKMFQHGKTGPAIGSLVGLLACGLGVLFAFIYGWTKAGEWNIKNVMIAWTVAILGNIGTSLATLPAQMEAIRAQQEQMQGGNLGVPIDPLPGGGMNAPEGNDAPISPAPLPAPTNP